MKSANSRKKITKDFIRCIKQQLDLAFAMLPELEFKDLMDEIRKYLDEEEEMLS